MKNELGRKIITEFAVLIPRIFGYLTDNKDKNKKAKSTKNCSFTMIYPFYLKNLKMKKQKNL